MIGGIIFVAALGFAHELCWVAWVRSVTGNSPVRAALATMLLGAFGLVGVVSVLEGGHPVARGVALVLGYGAGSWVAVQFADPK